MTAGPLQSPDRAELLFALGVVGVLVSGLLPWLTATEPIPATNPSERAEGLSSFSEADTTDRILGIDRVGWVGLAGLGIVGTAIVLTEPWSRVVLGVGGVSAAAAIAVGALYVVDPVWMYSDWLDSEVGAVTSVGSGVYLAIAGGTLQAVGCYFGLRGSATTGAGSLDQPTSGSREPEQPRREPRDGQQPSQQNNRRPSQRDQSRQRRPQRSEQQRRSPEQDERQKRD
jgi:hypothetical protein